MTKIRQIILNTKVNLLVRKINKLPTEEEKVLFIHDYLIDNNYYQAWSSHRGTAYGSIVQGSALCAGYTNGFTMLARKSGIVCGPVVGDNHVWNYVIIDGVEYMIDVTWDDARDEKHRHDYFMLTPEEMARDHPIFKDYAKYNPALSKGPKRTYVNSGK